MSLLLGIVNQIMDLLERLIGVPRFMLGHGMVRVMSLGLAGLVLLLFGLSFHCYLDVDIVLMKSLVSSR